MLQTTATKKSLRGLLLLKGLTLSAWARENGYTANLVTGLVSRFAGKEKRPKSGVSLKVIEALERDTGMRICG